MQAALERVASLATGDQLGAMELPWYRLRPEHTRLIRERLAESYAAAGANLRLCALRGVLRECSRLGLLDAKSFHALSDLPPVRGPRSRKSSRPSPVELQDLFRACVADPSPAGARDRAAIALLYTAALNRTQAASLDLDDYRRGAGALRVRRGQHRRYRTIDESVRLALEAWLVSRGEKPGPLLCPVTSSGRVLLRRLTPQALLLAYKKRAKQADETRTSGPRTDFRWSDRRPEIRYHGAAARSPEPLAHLEHDSQQATPEPRSRSSS
jgi:integrase